MKVEKREYNNELRAERASNTTLKIIKAVGRLWTKHALNDITLELIAQEAGVTARTILRKFGSKEGLLEECLAHDPANTSLERNQGIVGDVDHALRTLLDNYEQMGDAAIRTINLESELDIAQKIGAEGRKQHRAWCAHMFAPYLPEPTAKSYEVALAAFISATEIYLWKLMRRDLNMTYDETLAVFKRMVNGLVLQHQKDA